jgi:AcrR family transcriptional regulator
MSAPGKGGRYHHGDLRAALVEVAIELISENGVRGFSMAEASRRLGVAVSAPYAHFTDREDLLAAVAVRAWEVFYREILLEIERSQGPEARLAGLARCYVRFAGFNRPLFAVLFTAGIDKRDHPEIEAAERPVSDALLDCVRALSGGGKSAADDLSTALEATAHGHAMLLLDGDFGDGDSAVEQAAERAAAATLALIEGRHSLSQRTASKRARSLDAR